MPKHLEDLVQPGKSLQSAEAYGTHGNPGGPQPVGRIFVDKNTVAVWELIQLAFSFHTNEVFRGKPFDPKRFVDRRSMATATGVEKNLAVTYTNPHG